MNPYTDTAVEALVLDHEQGPGDLLNAVGLAGGLSVLAICASNPLDAKFELCWSIRHGRPCFFRQVVGNTSRSFVASW